MYKAHITITLRESILDPKGKASHKALQNLGYNSVSGVRIGKFVVLDINASNPEEALQIATESCQKLLANEVMENFEVTIVGA